MQKGEAAQHNRDDVLRELLKNEFQKRAQKNPAFSLRAFSQKLGLDQSLLSKILQGKRNFSNENAQKVSQFLGVYLDQTPAHTPLQDITYDLLKEDEFYVLSTWYHFALLELAKTKGFKPKVSYISERLGISDLEAERALERLERLNFIEIKKDKLVLKKPSNHWLNFAATTSAKINLQKHLHQKALEALEDIPFAEREHSGLTVAIDPALLPELKKKMMEFRRGIDKFTMDHGKETAVYHLVVSLFPLSDTKKIKESKKNRKHRS